MSNQQGQKQQPSWDQQPGWNQQQGFNQGSNQQQGFNQGSNQPQGFNQGCNQQGQNQQQGWNPQNPNQGFNQQGQNQGFNQQGQNQGFNHGSNQGFNQHGSNQGFNQNQNQGFNQNQNQGFNQQVQKPSQYFKITCKSGGRCLDLGQQGQYRGHLVIWDYWKGPNQEWGMTIVNGKRVIINKQGLCLTVQGDSSSQEANITAQPYSGAAGQFFGLQPVKQGSAEHIIVTHCGKVLDCCEEGKKNGTKIIQYQKNGHKNQQWVLENI